MATQHPMAAKHDDPVSEFHAAAQFYLGMSGEEFLRRYDAGEFDDLDDVDDVPGLHQMTLLMPLVR